MHCCLTCFELFWMLLAPPVQCHQGCAPHTTHQLPAPFIYCVQAFINWTLFMAFSTGILAGVLFSELAFSCIFVHIAVLYCHSLCHFASTCTLSLFIWCWHFLPMLLPRPINCYIMCFLSLLVSLLIISCATSLYPFTLQTKTFMSSSWGLIASAVNVPSHQ
jgi:hypothetical protein